MRAWGERARAVRACCAATIVAATSALHGCNGAPTLPQQVATDAVGTLEAHSVHAARIDWTAVRARMAQRMTPQATLADAHTFVAELVAEFGDPHTRYAPAEPAAAPATTVAQDGSASPGLTTPDSGAAPAAGEPPHAELRTVPTLPGGHMRDDQIAYVQLPGCADTSPAHVRAYADALAGAICELATHHPAGWIVDLRLNGGGTMWPMLQGLAPLAGDGTLGGSVSPRNGRTEYGVTAGSAWLRRTGVTQEQLAPAANRCGATAAPAPIAILIGPWTMSSGEIAAAAFARMPLARMFGEPSAGLVTATEPFRLADGSTLTVATAAIVDSGGTELDGPIAPDTPAHWGDWPTSDDAAVRAAHAWLRAHDRADP